MAKYEMDSGKFARIPTASGKYACAEYRYRTA